MESKLEAKLEDNSIMIYLNSSENDGPISFITPTTHYLFFILF